MDASLPKNAARRSLALAVAIAAQLAAASAVAQGAPGADADAGELGEITVFGRGETRQVTTLTATQLEVQAPGTSPLKAIEKLPGVSFQSADPYGAYEWSTRISIRGFNQNQLGFTLDGVPLGDMSYGNHNGLHVSRAIAAENVGRVVLSQGAGALGTASTSNLGGTLAFFSADPSREFGANAAVTGGSDSTLRIHARLETGELGGLGTRGYLSYTDQSADKWKGVGEQNQEQINLKLVQPIGSAQLTAFYNWSDRAENDYQDLSPEMIRRLGYDWDNISGDWALAVRLAQIAANRGDVTGPLVPAAGTIYPAPFRTVDDAYFDAAGLRKDDLAGITLDAPLAAGLETKATAYLHRNEGQGIWYTPYVPTPGGAPISIRTTEYEIERQGVTLGFTWQLGAHTLGAGYWYENNEFQQARRFYGLDLAAPQRSSLDFQRDPFFTQWLGEFETKTNQFYLQNQWQLTDAVKVSFGFKSTDVENTARQIVGTFPAGTIDAKDNFLPQFGVNWAVAGDHEVFASYTENMRAFVSANTSGPFGTTQAGFDAIRGSLEPERSKTYELGWRYNGGAVQAMATVYNVDFTDRLLGIRVGAGILGNPAVLQNVGDVRTIGVETGLAWEVATNWRLYGSYTYNQSEYQDDVVTAAGVTRLDGRTAVDSPENLAKLEFGYDDSKLFARIGVSHVGERFYTYTNDASVDSYTILDLSGGYRFGSFGVLKNLTAQFNVTNLADEEYVSTIGSNGFTNTDATGTGQTVLAGAPRQVFLTVNASF
ncbi:MAG: TonB-dependent receptor family protein [Pseudomonadota bacterium]